MEYKLRSAPVVGERLDTWGIDYGPEGITLIHQIGDYGLVKWHGHMAWTDNFSPWHWEPTRYVIVKLHDDLTYDWLHNTLQEPGAKWRSCITGMKHATERLAIAEAG